MIKRIYKCVLITAVIFIAASGIGRIFKYIGLSDTNIVVVYLLAVLTTAWLTRSFIYGFTASFFAAFLFNYFFVEPAFTFSVNDPNYIITFTIMTFTALIANILTSHVKGSAQKAVEKETEVIKAREEIIKERCRANLLRAISHDIRTPLSGMIGTTEMLMDMTDPGTPNYKLVLSIQKDAEWLHSMVENILSLTRLQDGKLSINKQKEAIEEIIGGAISHITARNPEREILVRMPDNLLLVPVDAKLIEQVIINLLDNAVRHTKPECEISITVDFCEDTNTVKLAVSDRGTGISEKDLPNIFKMFYISSKKSADTKYGIGLGLVICETIIKAHGGNIEARKRTDGDGAEFIFTLPMDEMEQEDGYEQV